MTLKLTEAGQNILEIDASSESLFELSDRCTAFIRQGYLLHGTTLADLEELEPKESVDTLKEQAETAVFATDQPTIAMARAVAGNNLEVWTRQVLFGVKDLKALQDFGYI